MRRFLLLAAALLLFSGCEDEVPPEKGTPGLTVTKKDIVRVFMRDPGRYFWMCEERFELKTEEPPYGATRIFVDVPPGDSMYVEHLEWADGTKRQCHIHIHRVEEINGAGWNHGEDGRGMTNVVE